MCGSIVVWRRSGSMAYGEKKSKLHRAAHALSSLRAHHGVCARIIASPLIIIGVNAALSWRSRTSRYRRYLCWVTTNGGRHRDMAVSLVNGERVDVTTCCRGVVMVDHQHAKTTLRGADVSQRQTRSYRHQSVALARITARAHQNAQTLYRTAPLAAGALFSRI